MAGSSPVRLATKETTSLWIVDAGRAGTEQANWSAPETVVTAGETAPLPTRELMMKLYLAASSAEIERATEWCAKLRHAGITVTSTWIDTIRLVGAANPRDANDEKRASWVKADFAEIDDADALWLLVPAADAPTRGAWIELGYAWSRRKAIVCSGDTRQSIFCVVGDEYETDERAFGEICRAFRMRQRWNALGVAR